MKYNAEIHHRQSIRLKGYDYSQNGAYFVTVCTHNRECLLGKIMGGEMMLNKYGKIVEECWWGLINHYQNMQLDYFIVMPNHFHGIIMINNVGAGLKPAPTVFDVGESGTTLRFLLPLLSFLGHSAVVKGKGTLVGRPNHNLSAH